jgi:two-component system chemotaxis response regulator CheY
MPFDFKKLSILVVEDTAPMRKLITSVLETLGVGRVYSCDNGEAGFDLFRRENPDIVIADWHMLPMSGIELTEQIRKNAMSPNRMAPIILVTGYSALNRVSQARDAGVTEFLVKPFSANDLAKRIAYVINKPRDYIDCKTYFGPDRRRRHTPDYNGPFRRKEDQDGGQK